MLKKISIVIAALGLAALGACNANVGATLGPIALTAATAATAPACAAIAAKTAVPATLCTDAAGNTISILSALAQNGIKAHIRGHSLYIDSLPKGKWGKTL